MANGNGAFNQAMYQNPVLPTPTGPLLEQSNPDPVAPVLTTMDVNGPNGSVDYGGAVDQCALWLSPAAQQSWAGKEALAMAAANSFAVDRFGIPVALPTMQSMLARFGVLLLGGFLGGYHGYKRSHGKGLQTALWTGFGAFLPLPTLAVSVFQGYGKSKGR